MTSFTLPLSRLKDARIIVVGDAMVDVWVHGRVDRISPEAPVPVFVEERREERPGGSGNVEAILRELGCTVLHLTRHNHEPTKTRFMVNNQQIGLRHDMEGFLAIGKELEDTWLEQLSRGIECDVLIISDYAKGVCTPSLCQRLIAWARAKGIKTVVDPKGKDWHKYAGCTVITPNQAELHATEKLYQVDPGFGAVLVTKGAAGMHLTSMKHNLDIPATNSGPVDVTGAGDTVVAVLAAALAVGFDLEAAARLANAAAGVTVGKFGTATCSIEELETAMGGKIRQKAAIVGFANGVFDCFHDGHRHFLRECRMNCDKLLVALNGIDYAHWKGAQDSLAVRRENVFSYAEQVEVFNDEKELLALMQRIKPDVIFKGEDYHGKPVTGGDLARIHWVARHPGYSSTIERAKAKA